MFQMMAITFLYTWHMFAISLRKHYTNHISLGKKRQEAAYTIQQYMKHHMSPYVVL